MPLYRLLAGSAGSPLRTTLSMQDHKSCAIFGTDAVFAQLKRSNSSSLKKLSAFANETFGIAASESEKNFF